MVNHTYDDQDDAPRSPKVPSPKLTPHEQEIERLLMVQAMQMERIAETLDRIADYYCGKKK
jgi:hypothetical protein